MRNKLLTVQVESMAIRSLKLPPLHCNWPLFAQAILRLRNALDTKMKVISIDTGHFKLDGGAMFGVIPKSIWQKMIPADDQNLCSWTMRCLLIDTGKKVILVDTGLGD